MTSWALPVLLSCGKTVRILSRNSVISVIFNTQTVFKLVFYQSQETSLPYGEKVLNGFGYTLSVVVGSPHSLHVYHSPHYSAPPVPAFDSIAPSNAGGCCITTLA